MARHSTHDSLVNKTLAGREGAVVATLALLSSPAFAGLARVAEDGCRLLRNLADGVLANHALVLRRRAVALALDAVRRHGAAAPGVAEHGLALFVNLANKPALSAKLRGGSGDLAAAARALAAAHADTPRVTRQAALLLHLLGGGSGDDCSYRRRRWRRRWWRRRWRRRHCQRQQQDRGLPLRAVPVSQPRSHRRA